MIERDKLPALADLPIPADVRPGKGWTPIMVEMADHIGAYATLKLLDHFGGEFIYFPKDPTDSKFTSVVGEQTAVTLSRIYGGERMELPLGKQAILRARRAGVLAAVRAGNLTGDDAARILKTRRTALSRLLRNHEGEGAQPIALTRRKPDPRQIDMFGSD